jgi:hypothetical protein
LVARQDITARKERPDIRLRALKNEPIERMLPKDPTDPREKDDPTEPIDMNEFREPILSTELVDPMLHSESLFFFLMRQLWARTNVDSIVLCDALPPESPRTPGRNAKILPNHGRGTLAGLLVRRAVWGCPRTGVG